MKVNIPYQLSGPGISTKRIIFVCSSLGQFLEDCITNRIKLVVKLFPGLLYVHPLSLSKR